MKKVFYTLSGLFSMIALILAFENIAMSVPVAIFFEYKNLNLFFPLFFLFLIGFFAGFFFALAIKTKNSSAGDDENF